MIKDITIGQYFPGSSFIHKLDARTKIISTLLIVVMMFMCKSFASLGLMTAFVIVLVVCSRVSVRTILKSIKPLVIIIFITAIFNIIYIKGGTVYFSLGSFEITRKGLESAAFLMIRIISLVVSCSLLTYTTTPTMLTDGISSLLSPLKKLNVNVDMFAMMMTLALRFIPTLIEEVDRISSAQKARGADLESGGLISRVKAMIPIIIPLFVSSYRRAYELAFAMECRGYTCEGKRTRMKVMKFGVRDLISVLIISLVCAGIILLNIYFTNVI